MRKLPDPLGTWATNTRAVSPLEALKGLNHACAVVMVTTDKVYANREWISAIGRTIVSAVMIHTARRLLRVGFQLAIQLLWIWSPPEPLSKGCYGAAGNVIGGGDWAVERIVPDAIRALMVGKPIPVRNYMATRPWQHVLNRWVATSCSQASLCQELKIVYNGFQLWLSSRRTAGG